ncbi:MAG TPA: iron-containing alcohol dehydrogenase, partial [Bryobacteraceae bacterium]|nr:iron-containing alcohol dehydrogenase [Bryobacteraceae bacterium]
MNLSTFSFPTTIVFGAGSVSRLPDELKKRNVRRPLLVTDAGIERTAMFTRVRALTPEAAVFSKVDPNPTEQNVLDGAAAYQAAGCDGVIAL